MLFTIDIGNTNITFGLYDKQQTLKYHWRIKTDHGRLADEYGIIILGLMRHEGLDFRQIRGVAIASVVPPLTPVFDEMIERYIRQKPLVVGAGVKTGVQIRYDSPRDVGADRIVDAAATFNMYGGPACIVDFGTATTFDAISEKGEYLGGAIAPGVGIAAEALFSRTSKLPRVDLVRPPRAIGSNTVNAIQSGMIFGYVGLVEGMVARFKAELGDHMRVIGTGGLAQTIAQETDVIEVVNPWLTLEGLRLIWEMNQ
ncbi:MAG TPA: type III pantothenate kinase [Anaerolineae bacterium]|nr:type III pantothenate kinase [Anaerolineae bacterium]MCB0223283.1 type III pantothenate kinase [Anaerolineae bacterium]MCB9107551.1 type III pantothenate kinase [Anaerolineales bacterium]HRV92009.1 type III pantothenate kinase [Anaerolineae bacterium]